MKKLLIAVLTSLMLVGCGGGETTEANNKKEAYVFEVNGTSIAVNQDFSEVSNALGDPQSKFTSPSCAFEGQDDNVYTYASYQITTYTNSADGKEYVYSIILKDDTVSTKEGISLGTVKDDVYTTYGEGYTENSDTSVYWVADNCNLEFIFEDDSVIQITYTAIIE
ncbi:MAG: hypothetical protein U0L85_04925 [Bacilli bacterium]|nr:hypothetical protein [Bacilli bacterium]